MSQPDPPPAAGPMSETLVEGQAPGSGRTRLISRAHDATVYAQGEVIGRGGMGEVVSVFDRSLARNVVMKRMHAAAAEGEQYERFLTEARVTGQLSHPNIVPVYELGVGPEGEPFFTMKHVDGDDLRGILDKLRDGDPEVSERFTLARRLSLFGSVCNAMAFAHEQGVVHRDLKPANIMVGAFGEVLVMDWGLAQQRGDARPSGRVEPVIDETCRVEDPLLTQDGAVMGTPGFMSPEQARGDIHMIDARSDIYSLGVVLFELLLLRPPYRGNSIWELLTKVTDGQRDAPGSLPGDPRVPRELVAVLDKAMALDPEDRYPNVQALHDDLLAFSDHRALAAASYTPLQRLGTWLRRHRAAVLATLIAVTALFGGVSINAELRRRSDEAARERQRETAWAAYREARQQPSGDDFYARQTAVLERARELAEVDRSPEARAQRAEAARALARRLADDGNERLARLLLREAAGAGLPADAVELERWMIDTARSRRGQSTAFAVQQLLDKIAAGDMVAELASHRVIGLGAHEASTRVLIAGLLTGKREVAMVCARALGGLGDRTTQATVVGKIQTVTVPWRIKRRRLAVDKSPIVALRKKLAAVIARTGRSADAPEGRRQLRAARALALSLHTRSLGHSFELAEDEVRVVWAALEAIVELGDPAAIPLLSLWQWRQGPDSLGWMLAAHALRRLSAPDELGGLPDADDELTRALTQLSLGRDRAALATLGPLLEAEPGSAMLRYLRAFAQCSATELEARAAARDLAALRGEFAKAPAEWLGAIDRLTSQLQRAAGDRAGALATLKAAGERGDALALAQLARLAEQAGNADDARRHAAAALKRRFDAQQARLVLCRLTSGTELAEHAREAIALDPGASEPILQLALHARRLGRLEAAISHCDTAIHQGRDIPSALSLRGQTLLDLCVLRGHNQLRGAGLRDLERAVDARPTDDRFRLEMLRGLMLMERYGEAVSLARRLRDTSVARSASALQAWTHMSMGHQEEGLAAAREALRGARGDEPHLAYAYMTAGLVLGFAHRHEGMRAQMARARELAEPWLRPRVDLELARREAAVGQIDAAIKACRAALADSDRRWLHGNAARAHLERWLIARAQARLRAGDRAGGIRDLEAALAEGSGHAGMRKVIERNLELLRGR